MSLPFPLPFSFSAWVREGAIPALALDGIVVPAWPAEQDETAVAAQDDIAVAAQGGLGVAPGDIAAADQDEPAAADTPGEPAGRDGPRWHCHAHRR